MIIKEIKIQELRIFANDLLGKTYLQLGQKPNAEDMFQLSLILAEDLKDDFETLTLEDIQKAFREGLRNTDDFHLTIKVYYKWIKAFRQVIWNNETIEPQMQDKRLKYRHRQGTGMKRINIKDIKQLKQ
jgi:hypothetical protein